jgi:hypothetical protein
MVVSGAKQENDVASPKITEKVQDEEEKETTPDLEDMDEDDEDKKKMKDAGYKEVIEYYSKINEMYKNNKIN